MKITAKLLETMRRTFASLADLSPHRPVPTGKALRDPEDPVQAERIHAAKVRRIIRSLRRRADYAVCVNHNPCIPLDTAPANVGR